MSSNIFFHPFVGKDYANGGIFGKRIMILGESHYCDEECADCGDCRLHRECMGFTQQVLDDYLNEGKERQNWMRTFLKFERSLVGEETDQAMRLKIWNSVVFFNYLQVAIGDYWSRVMQRFYSLYKIKTRFLVILSFIQDKFAIFAKNIFYKE